MAERPHIQPWPTNGGQDRQLRRRRRRVGMAAAGAALVVALGSGAMLLSGSDASSDATSGFPLLAASPERPEAPAAPQATSVAPTARRDDRTQQRPTTTTQKEPQRQEPISQTRPRAGRLTQAQVINQLDARKTVVLLFWTPDGSDDRATERTVRALDLRGGRVIVHTVSIDRVGEFAGLASGLVTQSPTTLIIRPNRRVTAITGLTDRTELDRAVG